MLGIVLPDQIQHDGAALPDGEVVVCMVDDRGKSSVGIEVSVRRLLVFHYTTGGKLKLETGFLELNE